MPSKQSVLHHSTKILQSKNPKSLRHILPANLPAQANPHAFQQSNLPACLQLRHQIQTRCNQIPNSLCTIEQEDLHLLLSPLPASLLTCCPGQGHKQLNMEAVLLLVPDNSACIGELQPASCFSTSASLCLQVRTTCG